MNRRIRPVDAGHAQAALALVEEVFAASEGAEEGRMVRRVVEEIRAGGYHVPELELMALDEAGAIIGYAMFSRFHLEGRYDRQLLLLSPVAVATAMQRQHISRDIIEHGFTQAAAMGFEAVLVEGNPRNYRARGFVTACEHGIVPGPNVHLPSPECLMVRELKAGVLAHIHGMVDYGMYPSLT